MEYASQLANIANVQNYAAQFKDTRLSSLKHPGEFFDYQKVGTISQTRRFVDEQVSLPTLVSGLMVGITIKIRTDRLIGVET